MMKSMDEIRRKRFANYTYKEIAENLEKLLDGAVKTCSKTHTGNLSHHLGLIKRYIDVLMRMYVNEIKRRN